MRSRGPCCALRGRVVVSESFLVEAVPRDVEADVLAGLARFGFQASTEVPIDREAGTVRVSRTGGGLELNSQRDRPQVLVEVWGDTSVDAFDTAIRVWAAFRIWGDRGWIVPGVAVHDVDADVPRARDDELAPELYRTQFVSTFLTDLTTIELTEEAAHG